LDWEVDIFSFRPPQPFVENIFTLNATFYGNRSYVVIYMYLIQTNRKYHTSLNKNVNAKTIFEFLLFIICNSTSFTDSRNLKCGIEGSLNGRTNVMHAPYLYFIYVHCGYEGLRLYINIKSSEIATSMNTGQNVRVCKVAGLLVLAY
jgi:hypothetical protein